MQGAQREQDAARTTNKRKDFTTKARRTLRRTCFITKIKIEDFIVTGSRR